MTGDGTPPGAADERGRLVDLLRRLGAREDEIAGAFAGDSVAALAVAAAMRAGRAPVTAAEAAAAAGISDTEFAEVWRALGLTAPTAIPGGVPRRLADTLPVIAMASREWLDPEAGLGLARVIGGTPAQLAEAVGDA